MLENLIFPRSLFPAINLLLRLVIIIYVGQNKASFQACTSHVIYETFMFTHFDFSRKAFLAKLHPSLDFTTFSLKVANEAQLFWASSFMFTLESIAGAWEKSHIGWMKAYKKSCLIRLQEISFRICSFLFASEKILFHFYAIVSKTALSS